MNKNIIGDVFCIIGIIICFAFYLGMRYAFCESAGGYGWEGVTLIVLGMLRKGYIG